MPDLDDDFPDAEWTGRPQDDPRLHAQQANARAEFRDLQPPVNCWIDRVDTIELYLDGALKAQVERGRSAITFIDEHGHAVSKAIYLCSENPYDVVEAHLGIARIAEIRDESNEAEDPFSAYPREREERQAAAFRARYVREDEIFLYLRSAASALKHEGDAGDLHQLVLTPVLEAVTAAVLDQYEAALAHLDAATSVLEKREPNTMFGRPAIADCRRAIVAIERHVAIQDRLPLRRRQQADGKSGG